jgi:hypothetical protein
MPRVPRRLALAVLLSAVLGGCLSPTLPLPPPNRPDEIVGPNDQGMVLLRGRVLRPSARVQAFNTGTGKQAGDVADDGGVYEILIGAEVGDQIELWYEIGKESSTSILFTIEPAQ